MNPFSVGYPSECLCSSSLQSSQRKQPGLPQQHMGQAHLLCALPPPDTEVTYVEVWRLEYRSREGLCERKNENDRSDYAKPRGINLFMFRPKPRTTQFGPLHKYISESPHLEVKFFLGRSWTNLFFCSMPSYLLRNNGRNFFLSYT